MITLELTGKPEGKARPRFGKGGRVFTPNATKLAETRIIDAWKDADCPRLNGAIKVGVLLKVARPKSHYTTKGALGAVGLRLPRPIGRKPDVDNALKLVMDALNGRAYRDDVDVVEASVHRVWSDDGWESTTILLEQVAPSAETLRQAAADIDTLSRAAMTPAPGKEDRAA